MPGPSSRKSKPKRKPGAGNASTKKEKTTIHLPEIEDVEGWNEIIGTMCLFFELPDFNKRSGMKQAHADFETIYTKLSLAYELCGDLWKIKGGVVGIVAKMCSDTLLRNKLFQKGVLDLVFPLLKVEETRHIALQTLVCFSRPWEDPVSTAIMQQIELFVSLLLAFPDDNKVIELTVMLLALVSPSPAMEKGRNFPRSPNIQRLLETVTESVLKPENPSGFLVESAIDLIKKFAAFGWRDVRECPAAIQLLIAGLRSKDWIVKSKCFDGLLDLYAPQSEEEGTYFDSRRIATAFDRFSPKLDAIINEYGIWRSELLISLNCSNQAYQAVQRYEEDKDLYALALKYASLTMNHDTSVVQLPLDGRVVEEVVPKGQLPSPHLTGILPYAAAAIRAQGRPDEDVFADALDLKYFFLLDRPNDALALTAKGIAQRPKQGYYYYCMARLKKSYPMEALRATKKGLRCELAPFIRRRMLHLALHLAGHIGFELLKELADSEAGHEKWEKGIAFVMSAYEDAEALLDECPPDSKYVKDAGYWYLLLTILIRKELSQDLRELKEDVEKVDLAKEFYETIFAPCPKTHIRMAQDAVLKHYTAATEKYGRFITALDKAKQAPMANVKHGVTADEVEDWFERMNLEDPTDPVFAPKALRIVNFEHVTLYRCSWCGNPSAALKKCSRCTKTMYCDGDCQKGHWSVHKKACMK